MQKLLWFLTIGLILFISFASSAHASVEHYKKYTNFSDNFVEAYEFKNTNGNERLMLKTLADTERAGTKTVHYDERKRQHYICTWMYNEVLGRWVCGKNYDEAQNFIKSVPAPTCDIGYKLNENKTGCVRVQIPENAHLNELGNGWRCNTGYHLNSVTMQCVKNQDIYVQPVKPTCVSCVTIINQAQPIYITAIQNIEPQEKEVIFKYVYLAKTGPSIMWLLFIGFFSVIIIRYSGIFIK